MKRGMVRSNSMRSRGSSASTPPTPPPRAPRERLKDCCRQLVAFMCTQVGVGGLVVGYALVGAFGFLSIEKQAALEAEQEYLNKRQYLSEDIMFNDELQEKELNSLALHRSGRRPWAVVHQLRDITAERLWAVTSTQNVFNESSWREGVGSALRAFQDGIAGAVKAGYDGRTVQEAWSFPAALTFSLSVFTMIGYGNLVPRSGWGKLATVVYAVLGIPLYVLYFMNMGRVLASTFRWLYTKMYQCTQDRVALDDISSSKDGIEGVGGSGSGSAVRVIVPTTACLWVLAGYVLVGTIMFAEWEGWNYLDASYFCVTSLCKIGFGDFVPGTGIAKSATIGHPQAGGVDGIIGMRADTGAGHTKLVINFVYLLLGMGLIAMCYNLMREEVIVKARELKAKLRMLGTPPPPITPASGDVEEPREEASPPGEEQPPSRPLNLRSTPIRLRGVGGYDGRSNDVVYCPPATHTLRNTAVVFFGGDLQDFPENMESHRDNKHYLRWNLESTAILLHSCFPESHIVVVRPSRSTTPKLATFIEIVSSDMDQNRMEFKTFSCYDNFVPCNNCGSPDHTPTHYALHHLERLLQGISSRIRSAPESELLVAEISTLGGTSTGENDSDGRPPEEGVIHKHEGNDNGSIRQRRARDKLRSENESREEEEEEDEVVDESSMMTEAPAQCLTIENGAASDEAVSEGGSDGSGGGRLWWRENINLDKAELTLVGFSKGCVVLNQFIYEFHYLKTLTPDDNTMMRLVTRIRDMFWLDGGHAGGKNTWITSRSLLETLTRLGIGIHIHVTPYQVQDERRPWIRKEEKTFGELLRRLGAPVSRTLHFESQPPTLYTHFDVLAVFRPPQSRIQ